MSDWFTVLKDVKQIQSAGIRTKLGTTPLTMGDGDYHDCCKLAREKFLEEQTNYYDSLMIEVDEYEGYSPPNARENWIRHFEEMLAMTDCKTFREVLQDMKNKLSHLESSIPYKNALRFWEECEK